MQWLYISSGCSRPLSVEDTGSKVINAGISGILESRYRIHCVPLRDCKWKGFLLVNIVLGNSN